MNEKPLPLHFLELFLVRLARASTKDELAPELPLERDVPVLRSLLVNNGVYITVYKVSVCITCGLYNRAFVL
jgi:hypothetical protein